MSEYLDMGFGLMPDQQVTRTMLKKDSNTYRVLLDITLNVSYKNEIWNNKVHKKGEWITTTSKICNHLNLTTNQVRDSLKKLTDYVIKDFNVDDEHFHFININHYKNSLAISLNEEMFPPIGDEITSYCDDCGIEIHPTYPLIHSDDGQCYCVECAFKKGIINSQTYTYLKFGSPIVDAAVKDNTIYTVENKQKFPWEKTNLDYRLEDKYKKWREDVMVRDNYTCQRCGQHGGKLEVHHIYKFSKYPDKRTELSNGVTLCEKCHKEVHHTKEKEFLKG